MPRDPYINQEYYKKEYEGEEVADADFPKYAKRASDIIDQLTSYQIPAIGLDKFSELVQELVMKAAAAQVEYYQLEGLEVDVTGQTEGASSVSLGKFNYSTGNNSTSRQSQRVAPNAISYLEGTGLIKKNGVSMRVI